MEIKVYNQDSMNENEVKYRSIRVKALIINSKNEMLVGYSHNTYQFIGGHLEEGEDLVEGLIREVEEEAGMKVEKSEIKPFFLRKKYYRDYPEKDSNSCYEYHYYTINTDKLPNLNNVNYTEAEKVGKFELRYIPIDEIENEFEENKKVSERTKTVQEENLEAINVFKNL